MKMQIQNFLHKLWHKQRVTTQLLLLRCWCRNNNQVTTKQDAAIYDNTQNRWRPCTTCEATSLGSQRNFWSNFHYLWKIGFCNLWKCLNDLVEKWFKINLLLLLLFATVATIAAVALNNSAKEKFILDCHSHTLVVTANSIWIVKMYKTLCIKNIIEYSSLNTIYLNVNMKT